MEKKVDSPESEGEREALKRKKRQNKFRQNKLERRERDR